MGGAYSSDGGRVDGSLLVGARAVDFTGATPTADQTQGAATPLAGGGGPCRLTTLPCGATSSWTYTMYLPMKYFGRCVPARRGHEHHFCSLDLDLLGHRAACLGASIGKPPAGRLASRARAPGCWEWSGHRRQQACEQGRQPAGQRQRSRQGRLPSLVLAWLIPEPLPRRPVALLVQIVQLRTQRQFLSVKVVVHSASS